jgi:type I restriction enzyme M protein
MSRAVAGGGGKIIRIIRGNMASKSRNNRRTQRSNGANLGFEEKMWQAADKLRGHMDAAEYKHVVLGLVFLKYIFDAFQERYRQLELFTAEPTSDYFIREP